MGCGTHAVGRFFKCSEDLEMKKLAMTAIAAATVLCAGAAQAYTVGTFSNGVVVPNVIHNGPTDTTAVGLINRSGGISAVYWTFFDQDSNHVTDGCFPMTDSDYQPFVWSSESGTGLEGQRGYLVFALGTSFTGITAATACSAASAGAIAAPGANARLAANAFQVDATNKDVAYTPVVDGPLTLVAGSNLTTLGPTSLVSAAGAAPVGDVMNMRYFIDGATGGTDTLIAVWSTGDQRGTHTVNMFDDKQGRKSVNFKLDHQELDWFNPETITGRPAGFVDGFIEWDTGAVPGDYPGAVAGNALATAGGSVFTFSVINSPAFGAVQTVLGAHHAP